MEFSLIDTLRVIGALGLFIYGIKVMSENVQKSLGSFLKRVVNVMTRNRISGIFAGFVITALIFSSSATTVMAVSFVNIGLITLAESVSIMLGANIGTTIMTWLVSVFGFNADFSFIYLLIFALGTPLIFSSKQRLKYIGGFTFGLAMLFLGLSELLGTIPRFGPHEILVEFYNRYSPYGFFANAFFGLIGVFLTLLMQSSSASIVFTQVLCFSGIIPFEVAIPMVLGQNFGRTINTEIASISGNVFAKRSARIHSLVNILGLVWMVLALTFLPIIDWLNTMVSAMFGAGTGTNQNFTPVGIALFHTLYNVINVLLMVWFIPQLVKLATNTIKSKGDTDEQFRLEYISTGIMATPDMSIIEAQKEIAKFGELVKLMNVFTRSLINERDIKNISATLQKIKNYEEATDRIEIEVADYLAAISQGEMSETASIRIRSMLSIIGELERMGDIYYQASKILERKFVDRVWFTPGQRGNLLAMLDILDDAFAVMCTNLELDYATVTKTEASNLEIKLNAFRKKIRKEHYKNVERGEYDFTTATIYSDLFNSFEEVGDHIINVTEGVIGEI